MRSSRLVAGLCGVLALSSVASAVAGPFADNRTYMGARYGQLDFETRRFPHDHELDFVGLYGGYFVHPNVALEARAGTGLGTDTSEVDGAESRVSLDYLFASHLIGRLPLVASPASVFGALGFSYVGFGQLEPPPSPNDDGTLIGADGGFSVGAGLEVELLQDVTLEADYVRYNYRRSYDLKGFSVGLRVAWY